MNEEKNTTGTNGDTTESTNDATANRSTAGSEASAGSSSPEAQDDYYAVDHAKKDVLSTIGDGEMHDEGLAGAGDALTDLLSGEISSDEQDQAESHDTEQ